MTIGIAAFGPNAGIGIFKGLRAAERVGTGSIGGFATYAAITDDGRLLRSETQRGGSSTLFLEGETTGVEPPEAIATARFAALISSGPERPDLVKLVAADPKVGLVTGHRLPIQVGVDGVPMNDQALELMRAGRSPQEAVDHVIGRNPEADCGLIALDVTGRLYGRNTERVLRRKPDMSELAQESPDGRARVIVFYNAIRPHLVLAPLMAQITLDAMLGVPGPDATIFMPADLPVRLGPEMAIFCDAAGTAQYLTTADPLAVKGTHIGAVVQYGAPVYADGKLIGRAMFEVMTLTVDGVLKQMSGQPTMHGGIRHATA
ncbi:MAG: hypothetical protein U1E14_10145 [Geminicoccaceae bacterium]